MSILKSYLFGKPLLWLKAGPPDPSWMPNYMIFVLTIGSLCWSSYQQRDRVQQCTIQTQDSLIRCCFAERLMAKMKRIWLCQIEHFWGGAISLVNGLKKHRRNCECCPVSLFIVRSQWLSRIQVLYCLKCQQFLTSSQAMACVCHGLCICICLRSLIRLCLLTTLIKCLKVTRL